MSTNATAGDETTGSDDGTATEFDPLDVFEYDAKTGKRAVYEEFEFTPQGDGRVRVVNASHGDDAREEHTYTVHVESGIPFDCDCPAAEYHDGACKHQVAVALARPVADAAGGQLATDGGRAVSAATTADVDVDAGGSGYTYHYEAYEQGGERYARCERCGAELLTRLGGAEKLVHREGCPQGDR